MSIPNLVTPAFRALSAQLGQDPLQVQGPGGNTSIKLGDVMWIKASGTELADAERADIFVAVDRRAAATEAREQAGDGSCKDTVLDRSHGLRPSIETTFHAALDHAVVVHTHSVATLAHVTSAQGRAQAAAKLEGLPFVMVPYAKPGLPLTREILMRADAQTQIILLQNHGLICAGPDVSAVTDLLAEVERRLHLAPTQAAAQSAQDDAAPEGFDWAPYGWLGHDPVAYERARSGTYYPDHVVFLGPCLPVKDHSARPPAILRKGEGVLLRTDASASQRAMLRCLSDVLARVPHSWELEPIGAQAEAELLDWDAEKYRQALAARS